MGRRKGANSELALVAGTHDILDPRAVPLAKTRPREAFKADGRHQILADRLSLVAVLARKANLISGERLEGRQGSRYSIALQRRDRSAHD